MGWASAGAIFDRVTSALVDNNVPDDVVTSTCASLIEALTAEDWDTVGESIDRFSGEPAVIAAFRQVTPDEFVDEDEPVGDGQYDEDHIEREAWKLLLDGAESHWEDAIDEDDEFPEDVYQKILDRCGDHIKRLREEHVPEADEDDEGAGVRDD